MKYISIILFSSLCLIRANAQEKVWNLNDCMEYAVQHSPLKTKQEAQNNIYKQSELAAIGRLLPSVDANTQVYLNFGRGLDPTTNTYTDINSFNNSYNINASLTVFDGFASIFNLKMQKMNKLMGKQQLAATNELIAFETMQTYFTVLYQKDLVELAKKQLSKSGEDLKQVRRMEELGMKAMSDVAEMDAQQAADNFDLTQQQNLLTIAIIKLKEKMNFPIDKDISIDDYSSDQLIVKSNETALSIYNQSLSYLPKALAAKSNFLAQKLAYKSAKGSLYPTIKVEAGYSTNFSRYMNGSTYSPFKNQLNDNRGKYIGFTLSIPIFEGFSRIGKVKTAKYQSIMAESDYNITLRTLYSEIEQAIADMNGQADAYHQAQKQVASMQMAYEMSAHKYKEGLVSAIDLHTTTNRLLKAKVEEINAKMMYYLKARLVKYYQGEPFIQ